MKKIYRVMGKRGRTTIPLRIRQSLNLQNNDIISFQETEDGKSICMKKEKVCDNCCENEKSAEVSLLDFLNDLSPALQRAALVHLSTIWAQKGAANGRKSKIV
jgi:bifunctional DNA-binding transcriptional regulator/antitoxin component of YhaV-PrlF toxin-antitoxin module